MKDHFGLLVSSRFSPLPKLLAAILSWTPKVTHADDNGYFGLKEAAIIAKYKTNVEIPTVLNGILSAVFGFLGVVFLGMIIYGGYNWMTAMGETEKVDKGKNILIWSTIGLIVIFAAYAIVRFVITNINA